MVGIGSARLSAGRRWRVGLRRSLLICRRLIYLQRAAAEGSTRQHRVRGGSDAACGAATSQRKSGRRMVVARRRIALPRCGVRRRAARLLGLERKETIMALPACDNAVASGAARTGSVSSGFGRTCRRRRHLFAKNIKLPRARCAYISFASLRAANGGVSGKRHRSSVYERRRRLRSSASVTSLVLPRWQHHAHHARMFRGGSVGIALIPCRFAGAKTTEKRPRQRSFSQRWALMAQAPAWRNATAAESSQRQRRRRNGDARTIGGGLATTKS